MFIRLFRDIIRLIQRDRTITIIKLFGLSVAIAFSALLLIFIDSEKNVDKFHKNSDRIL